MNQDILLADKNLRRNFFIFLGLLTMAGILLAPHFNEYVEQIKQISKENPELAFKKSMTALKVSLGLVFLLLLMIGIYLILLARRTLKSGRYPPPGMRVIRDTRLRTRTQARRGAIFLVALSSILIVVALFFLYWPYAFEKTLLKKKSPTEKMTYSFREEVKQMKGLKIAMLCVISSGLIFSLAIAANVEKGKALFNDPKFGGGTAGMSCNSCHPDGKGLEKAGDRKDLEKQVNSCIMNALKGKGIDPKSAEMADIVAYLKSLKGKAPAAGAPKK